MRSSILVFAIASMVTVCAAAHADSGETNVCRLDPDTCPGNHPVPLSTQTDQFAEYYAATNYPQQEFNVDDSWGTCQTVDGHESCNFHYHLGSLALSVFCYTDNHGNAICDGIIEVN